MRAGLRTFAGVAHRLEEVATRDGVLYVNDSKATNVASTLVGSRSFARGVHVILGGRGKGGDYAPLARGGRGARPRGVPDRRGRGGDRRRARAAGVPLHASGDLERRASPPRAPRRGRARSCCSRRRARRFDQYADFEARGDAFRGLVELGLTAGEGRRAARAEPGARCQEDAEQPAPLEHRILLTATLCLLAGGAVMVYWASGARRCSGRGRRHRLPRQVRRLRRASASSRCSLLSRHGLDTVRALTPLLLLVAFVLLLLVLIPGLGVEGQRRAALGRRRPAAVPARRDA